MKLLITIATIVAGAILFVVFWKPFGGRSTKEERQDYQKRSEYFDSKSGNFENLSEFKIMESVPKDETDPAISQKGSVPKDRIPVMNPELKKEPSISDLTVTWFGHSSLLIQIHGMNILIDPVLSERSSPVGFIGGKRFSDVPMSAEELPEIDVMIISHNHYDHEDYNTITDLKDKVKNYVVAAGIDSDLERWGIDPELIHDMVWWEELAIEGLTIGCTPARHYSGRYMLDNYKAEWASWVIMDEYHKIYYSGDSGFDNHFEEIYQKYGAFELALMDCAQYDLRWPAVHMNPEQSYEAACMLKTEYVMPVHWAAFRLASHPWDDPAERYTAAAEGGEIILLTPRIGETMDSSEFERYQNQWWKEIE